MPFFKRDQIKTYISVKVKVLENCLCRECSMSTTLLEFLHISLTFNMTEGKSLMVRRIEWHWFIWTLVTLPPLKYIEIYIHFFQYMFLYACWFIDKVTYAYRLPISLSACIQVKKWTGKGWVFTKRLKGISNFVYALIDKKKRSESINPCIWLYPIYQKLRIHQSNVGD